MKPSLKELIEETELKLIEKGKIKVEASWKEVRNTSGEQETCYLLKYRIFEIESMDQIYGDSSAEDITFRFLKERLGPDYDLQIMQSSRNQIAYKIERTEKQCPLKESDEEISRGVSPKVLMDIGYQV